MGGDAARKVIVRDGPVETAATSTASVAGVGASAGEQAKGDNDEKTAPAAAGTAGLRFKAKSAEVEDDQRLDEALARLEQKKQGADKAGVDAGKDRAAPAPTGKASPQLTNGPADQEQAAALRMTATVDPQRSLAALRAPVTVDGTLPLADALRLIAGDQAGFTLAHGIDAALGRRVQVALRDEPAARGILRAVRSAGLQAQFTGGVVRLDTATHPLDPGDAQGYDLPTFKDLFGTQPMQAIAVDPVQTVAIDADTASYEYAKARVASGQPVDPATIKPEHFINAMPMDYPAAQGPEAFSLYAEAAPSPFARADTAWGARTALVSVGAVAKPAAADERKPLALTLAIDCSGSMAQAGGLDRIRQGLFSFVEHLRAEDRVSIVAFGDQARVILPATPGNDRTALTNALGNLATGGATNAAEGLALAYQLAAETAAPERESRVLLATDGGTVAGADELLRRVTAFKDRGITLVVVGTGQTYRAGPLQELASKGDGQHFYVGSDADAQALFTGRLLPDRLAVLAKDAKLQVTWNPQRVGHARLVGYDQRRLAAKDFRNNAVDAGELSQETQVTALFEVLLVDGGTGPLGTAAVRYHDTRRNQVRELACPLPGSLLASQPSDRLRLLACAAATAEWLQRGWWSNVHLITPEEIRAQLARCPQPIANELRAMVE
jgi:Ca-activated chloride channel homolog